MRNADERYQSARQFADDVVAWLHGDEVEALAHAAPEPAPAGPEPSGDDAPLDEETRDAELASLPPPPPREPLPR